MLVDDDEFTRKGTTREYMGRVRFNTFTVAEDLARGGGRHWSNKEGVSHANAAHSVDKPIPVQTLILKGVNIP